MLAVHTGLQRLDSMLLCKILQLVNEYIPHAFIGKSSGETCTPKFPRVILVCLGLQ